MSSTTILAPPITAASSTSSSSKINRLSTSSAGSHASFSSNWTPSRDSIYSVSSDGWSTSLVTPRGEKNFDVEILNDVEEDNDDKVEYIDLAGKESWWNAIPKRLSRQEKEKSVEDDKWSDDSPTLPSTCILPEIERTPPISLDQPISARKLGELPTTLRPEISVASQSEPKTNIFDVFSLGNGVQHQNDQHHRDMFASVPIRRPFTKRRPPIPSFSTNTSASSSSLPFIQTRPPPTRPPVPLRASSLKSLFDQTTANKQIARSSSPTPSHRPKPIRTFSHPPSTSLKKHRRISPVLLQPISETPKDLDIPPEGSWALRRPNRSKPIHKSRSQPNLRIHHNTSEDMTIKFRLKRSNSANGTSVDGGCGSGSDFMPLDIFPSSSRGSGSMDVDRDKDREGRASFSDMARSFVSRPSSIPVPESPSRMSLDGRQSLNLGIGMLKKSPKSNNFFSMRKNSGQMHSQRRPSLLGLPEWSSRPNSRSINESYVPQISYSKTFEALTLRTESDSKSPLRLSIDVRRRSGEDFFKLHMYKSHMNTSRHSIASSISSNTNHHLEEDLLAVIEAEQWNWPSPPFRVTKGDDTPTPGLSTSGTLESMISTSPQTPSESEFVLHGEIEYLAKSSREKDKDKRFRPLSLEGSVESLDITL
ncbi:hypothetical protein I204_01160 [Kwoniella mangroviensis CBS 8886]|nr:hypothetical protein I204_01160 [Kwoniella mangroviensis CBS 8886]